MGAVNKMGKVYDTPMARHDFDNTELMQKIFKHGDGNVKNINFNAIDISNIAYWIYQNAFHDGLHAGRGQKVESLIK